MSRIQAKKKQRWSQGVNIPSGTFHNPNLTPETCSHSMPLTHPGLLMSPSPNLPAVQWCPCLWKLNASTTSFSDPSLNPCQDRPIQDIATVGSFKEKLVCFCLPAGHLQKNQLFNNYLLQAKIAVLIALGYTIGSEGQSNMGSNHGTL